MIRALALLALLVLGGCGSLLTEGMATASGVAGASLGAAITSNATVAAAVGLGVDSAAREGLRFVERRVHRAEQRQIASVAGSLAPGTVGNWAISHDVPIERDERGQVVVSREFGALSFRCRDIVFSVDERDKEGLHRSFYTATVCFDGKVWDWATAEPTTRRWGNLQ